MPIVIIRRSCPIRHAPRVKLMEFSEATGLLALPGPPSRRWPIDHLDSKIIDLTLQLSILRWRIADPAAPGVL